ncbi:MAG: hypothetical protein H7177_06435 [Rhizobacter sp.]|nr:hypothetical protein [Bacteriovorax sp.]
MDNNQMKVLVTDSDENFLKVANAKLAARGFDVHTSSSAGETIEILKVIGFDSLLINIAKADERESLMEFLDTLEVKPVILFSNKHFETEHTSMLK